MTLLLIFILRSILVFAADEDVVWHKLKLIVIPAVDFRNARLEDVFNFMVDASRTNDNTQANSPKGVNLVLNLTVEEKEKKVNLSSKKIQLLQLLNVVTKITGTRYKVTGSVIMITGQDHLVDAAKITKSYNIPLTISNDVRKKGAKKFLEELGVNFPEGTSATYLANTGKMLVVNSSDNIKIMEKILRGMGVAITE